MQRYFVSPDAWGETVVQITGEDASHISRVMRMSIGDRVIVCNNEGLEAVGSLIDISPSKAKVQLVELLDSSAEPACQVTLVQGMPKGDKLEWIIQKGTEIGISAFALVETERSVVHYEPAKTDRKLERFRKIAKEAAEQAHRARIPAVSAPVPFENWWKQAQTFDLVIFCYEGERMLSIRTALEDFISKSGKGSHSVAICIGPEGGFSPAETELALRMGAVPVTLGPRILRTETAGLVTASLVLYQFGEMGD